MKKIASDENYRALENKARSGLNFDLSEIKSETNKLLELLGEVMYSFMEERKDTPTAHEGFLRRIGAPILVRPSDAEGSLFHLVQRVRYLCFSEDMVAEYPMILRRAVENIFKVADELELDAELAAEYGSFEMTVDGNSRKGAEYRAARAFKEQALKIYQLTDAILNDYEENSFK